MNDNRFSKQFEMLTGHVPFPWQQALYDRFISDRPGNIPATCNLPTGLGKTNVIAVWLIALAHHPDKMPRRLVYVVNRRTVVDQTTNEVERMRKSIADKPELNELRASLSKLCAIAAGDPEPPLAISTLRGQFADNREWSADPSRPAVICGTVDMIGSRLLFSGYGVGFKGKPLHAGVLGQDVLLVHDEAHLEPAFQDLLVAIEKEQTTGRFPDRHPFRVMELSATSRGKGDVFELTAEEKAIPVSLPDKPTEPKHVVWQRLKSKKGLKFHPVQRDSVATTIGQMARDQGKDSGKAILIFVRTIDDVKEVTDVLTDKTKGGVSADQVQQLTGTMRGLERDELASTNDVFARFMPNPKVKGKDGTIYLICTSAGEVGVDISADHMVCDLSTLDSMAQRFGRVNRRGEGTAKIDVVYETDPNPKPPSPAFEAARWETKKILERLSPCDWTEEYHDASPSAVGVVMKALSEDERRAAFAPTPTILPATDILFDAWSMTSIRDKMPGRPPIEPYLHGIRDYEPPETQVAWREEVGVVTGELLREYPPRDLLDVYPVKPHELLRDRTARIWKELAKLAERHPLRPAWIVDEQGEVEVLLDITEFTKWDNKQAESRLGSKTVLLPCDIGGLTKQGTLDGNFPPPPKQGEPSASIDDDVSAQWSDDKGPMRKREWTAREESDPVPPKGMKLACPPIVLTETDDEEGEPIKTWHWLVRVLAADADARSKHPYGLDPHLSDAKEAVTRFVSGLSLDPELRDGIILAAQFHDLGKQRERWQHGIGNTGYPQTKAWAKSGKRRGKIERSPYRHEFGSMLDVQTLPAFETLSDDSRELVLHLIAAHHGWARPHFTPDQCLDDNHSGEMARQQSIEALRRFARLQRRFGRWGLAYLESLVRAADYAASAKAEKEGAK